MEETKLRHIAIVFLPQNPNLRGLSYDFLVKKKIIPQSSDFQVQPGTFSAPPISQIRFDNGIDIISEPEKMVFQMSKSLATEGEQKHSLCLLKDIPLKCVQHEPFKNMRYSAIGINFLFIRDDLNFNSFIETSIKTNSPYFKVEQGHQGKTNGIMFSYEKDEEGHKKQANITVRKALGQLQESEQSALSFEINVHYPQPDHNNISQIIESAESNYKKFKHFIRGLK